jgi:transcription factor TFIIIB component B''
MKRQPAEKWSQLETDKFYLALQIFGTDFMMIERVFEGERSRE